MYLCVGCVYASSNKGGIAWLLNDFVWLGLCVIYFEMYVYDGVYVVVCCLCELSRMCIRSAMFIKQSLLYGLLIVVVLE